MSHKKKRYNEFEEMLCRSQRILYHVCLAYTDKQPESIDDLYQEIVSNLWHGWPKFRGKSDTATWVYRVALNTAKSELRNLQRRGCRRRGGDPGEEHLTHAREVRCGMPSDGRSDLTVL